MAGERLQAFYDIITNPDRYRSTEQEERVNLAETADPSTWRDETSATLRERLASRKRLFLLVSYFAFVGTGLFAVYSSRFIPALTNNAIVQELLKWFIVVPLCVWIGTRLIRGKLRHIDWLVMLMPESESEAKGVAFYVGTRTEDAQGNSMFEPLKGFSFWGLSGVPLTLSDMADDWQRQWAKQDREASDNARIRLEDALYGDRETFIGRVTVVLTDGLILDETGKESDMYTKEPKIVDPDRYRDLAVALTDLRQRLDDRETELDQAKEEKQKWRQKALEKEERIAQRIVDRHGQLAESGMVPRSQAQPQQSAGEQAMTNGSAQK